MPNRPKDRLPRRLQVRFRRPGEARGQVGYTRNVSPTGMFIGTSSPLPPGTAIQIEALCGGRSVELAGEVVHAARVSPLLKKLRTSGMGVRFRDPDPKTIEVLIGDAPRRTRTGPPQDEPSPRSRLQEAEREPEPAPPEPAGPSWEGPEEGVYRLDLSDPERFQTTLKRQIQFGEAELETPRPAPVGEEIQLDIRTPSPRTTVRCDARVLRHGLPRVGARGTKVVPMRLALIRPKEVLACLRGQGE